MPLLLLLLGCDDLSPACATASESALAAWRRAALPSITQIAGCDAAVETPGCVAAVDELAALGEVVQALEADQADPRATLAAALSKAKTFLASRSVDAYAPLRLQLSDLESQCRTELSVARSR